MTLFLKEFVAQSSLRDEEDFTFHGENAQWSSLVLSYLISLWSLHKQEAIHKIYYSSPLDYCNNSTYAHSLVPNCRILIEFCNMAMHCAVNRLSTKPLTFSVSALHRAPFF
jgi:hypothetical protein